MIRCVRSKNEVSTIVKQTIVQYNNTSESRSPHLVILHISAQRSTAWVGRTPVLRSLIAPIPHSNIKDRVNVADGNTAEEARCPDTRLKRILRILVLTCVQTVVWHHIAIGIIVDLVAHECATPALANVHDSTHQEILERSA